MGIPNYALSITMIFGATVAGKLLPTYYTQESMNCALPNIPKPFLYKTFISIIS